MLLYISTVKPEYKKRFSVSRFSTARKPQSHWNTLEDFSLLFERSRQKQKFNLFCVFFSTGKEFFELSHCAPRRRGGRFLHDTETQEKPQTALEEKPQIIC